MRPIPFSPRTHLVALTLTLVTLPACSPDLSEFEVLRNPKISEKAPQQMIVIRVTGDPAESAGRAFKALYNVYYALDDADAGLPPAHAAPRARWLNSLDTPRAMWTGVFALPVSSAIQSLPAEAAAGPAEIQLETWQYGLVAEILHVGPYTAEEQTVARLEAYMNAEGVTKRGPHEEEYLKGPGMFFAGDPDEYRTLIRYEVAQR